MNVVIVESPAKAKTINRYLGSDYKVVASYGHVRDLPPKDGSVRPDDDFDMSWEVDGRAEKHMKAIAEAVASRLVLIHNATAGDDQIARLFGSDEDFNAIRLEPYLLATAQVHPDLAAPLKWLAQETAGMKLALVHGDVSPKNILIGRRGPVFLDAECAWYGDPAFDLAFCLNHLLLKCLLNRRAITRFLACYDRFAETYLQAARWELREETEARAAQLLPALMLGRVDGKSPVEYLTEEQDKDRVRRVARSLLADPPHHLAVIRRAWAGEIKL